MNSDERRSIKARGARMLAIALLMAPAVTADEQPRAVPSTPAGVAEILAIRPFELKEGYRFAYRKEEITCKTGFVVVLKVSDKELLRPRQSCEPVLYIGNQTAERVNVGYTSGVVIAIVPGEVDWKKTPIWFGTPMLPERVDAKTIEAERAKADAGGIKSFAEKTIAAALKNGGDKLIAADREQLRREIAPLVKEHAPDEKDLADALLLTVEKK